MSNTAQMLEYLSGGFELAQILTILALFVTGALWICLIQRKMRMEWILLLAYPVGLSLWGLSGFVLLLTGIPYRLLYIMLMYLLFFFIAAVCWYRGRKQLAEQGNHQTGVYKTEQITEDKADRKKMNYRVLLFAGVLITVMAIAVICSSGYITVSISNDSVYYYSVYPQTIVAEGIYRNGFDVFLTDVGQTTAIINCLPYFFGFNETFGIQLFLGFNLIGIFFLACLEIFPKSWEKKRIFAALLTTGILASATPFQIMSRWILANAYFMDFMFILFYLALRVQKKADITKEERIDFMRICIPLMAMLSMMRMEGGMMACLLILCISCLNYSNREIIMTFWLPVAFTQTAYYIMLFMKLQVDPLYSFLDPKKAAVMIGMLLAVLLYLGVIRGRYFLFLQKNVPLCIIMALLLGNVLLLILNSERYLKNLQSFGQNIILQNGWGYFGFFILVLLLMLPGTGSRISYPMLFTIGFILFTIAVCWARSGTLRVGIGDSGNRILMQIVPFVVFALAYHIREIVTVK